MALSIPGSATPGRSRTSSTGRMSSNTGFAGPYTPGQSDITGGSQAYGAGGYYGGYDAQGRRTSSQSYGPSLSGGAAAQSMARATGVPTASAPVVSPAAPAAGGGTPAGPVLTAADAPPTGAGADAGAMMSLDAASEPPMMMEGMQGNMLRNLGRRIYPQESMALASMGRVY